jgi:hypothetical protein
MGDEYKVSLIAEVGNYENMDKSLADKLKAIPKDAPFEVVVKAINEWGKNDVIERRKLYNSGRSGILHF